MNRRIFLKRMLVFLNTTALMNLWPIRAALSAAGEQGGGGPLHYQPLNGRTLRQIAADKIHHGSNGRFLNPMGQQQRGMGKLLRWKFFSRNQFSAYLDQQPVAPVQIDWDPVRQHPGTSVTFVKHASVMIRDAGRTLMVDPVFEGIFGFIKDYTPSAFNPRDMPACDHALITHGHYDHLDKASLGKFPKDTHVITPLGYDGIFSDLQMENRTALDWFDVYRDDHFEVMLLPANHWTMRNPFVGPNRSLWGGFLIRTGTGKNIYLSGDTAYFDGFSEIGRICDIDLAIFNLGAYEPRWFMAPSHINPRETVQAFKELNAKRLMVVHWGTFQLGDEPVHFPPMDVEKELEKEGLLDRWVRIGHGETYFA